MTVEFEDPGYMEENDIWQRERKKYERMKRKS